MDIKQISYQPEDALIGDYPDGEYSKPDLRDLLKEIALKAPKHLHRLGLELGLKFVQMEQIETEYKENTRQFTEVFTRWEQQEDTHGVEPYKWKHILDILEFRLSLPTLAKTIRSKLAPTLAVSLQQ